MKKLYLVLYMLLPLLTIAVSSQNSLSGTITVKETGNPLPGAIVYLPELKQGTITSLDGKYQLNNLPAGIFLVEIKSIGYLTYKQYLKIAGIVNLDVILEESAVEINEVVITGSVASVQKQMNPIPITSINRNELQRNSTSNLIDGLTRIPGVSQIITGSAISKPVIRGMGYNRILVLHDDIRQEGQQWGDEHGVEIDENSIDKVEIIKGPGSLVYGSDALAGVINFISEPSLPEGKIEGNILAGYQTNSRMMDYSAVNQGNIKGINWLIRGTYKKSGNFRNSYDNVVYNSGFNEKNLNGFVGLTKKWGYSFLRFSTFNQELGIIEGERDSTGQFLSLIVQPDNTVLESTASGKKLNSYDIDIPKQIIHHYRVQLNSKILIGEGNIETDFGFQKNIRKEFANPIEPDIAELYFLLNTFSYVAKYNFPNLSGWRNVFGVSGMFQANANKGEEQLIPDYNLNDMGLFLTSQKTWAKLHLSAGVRLDNRWIDSKSLMNPVQPEFYKFEAFTKKFSNASFGFGVTRNISTSVLLKFNYSNGFRAPNLAELATNGKHEGTFRYETGNKTLQSEVSHQLDAGIVYNTHHINVEINTFLNNVHHFIYLRKLVNVSGIDSIPDPSHPAPAFTYSQGNAGLYGGEISIDIHPHPYDYIHFEHAFSYVRGVLKNQTDSTHNLSFIPAPQYRAELRIQPVKVKKQLQKPYLFLEYTYFFKQLNIFSAYGTETPTPGYGLVNFGAGTEIKSPRSATIFAVHFEIVNILNVSYQSHLSRLKYAPVNPATNRVGIYNAGRNFSFKLEVPLNFK